MEIKTTDYHAEIIFTDEITVTITWDEMEDLFYLLETVLSISEDESTRDIHLQG